MVATVLFICSLTIYALKTVESVPPEACFQSFRWDDCGRAPEPVMYYWKPGSRCEVGLWRGCLPNLNMFKDEYECVSTCMFISRAEPEDYHGIYKEDEPPINELEGETTTTGLDYSEAYNATDFTEKTGGTDTTDNSNKPDDADKGGNTDKADNTDTTSNGENETKAGTESADGGVATTEAAE